ncbi:hypothetical protein WN51_13304 [Melipona quadrifasciata]|uniref:Uncharacterized protein n=1 Tax=Melipona quadrifasciata TaxID=166423 RepID=A0A0M9A3L0_9HYME|nr:hypothetical protein WN51_13304 [Melipona quadrifasciata]
MFHCVGDDDEDDDEDEDEDEDGSSSAEEMQKELLRGNLARREEQRVSVNGAEFPQRTTLIWLLLSEQC